MRFEQKHQRYKRLLHIGGNYKNVSFTIPKRHQLDVASVLLCGVLQKKVKCGLGSMMQTAQLPNDVHEGCSDLNDSDIWYCCDKI